MKEHEITCKIVTPAPMEGAPGDLQLLAVLQGQGQ